MILMKKRSEITVITVNYNNVKGLKKTIESVIHQNCIDYEFVIVDGGSDDGSVALIEGYSRINNWVSEKDKGVYHAMNKGIRMAKGNYVIFMNSGDIFYDQDVLGKFIPELDGNLGIVYGNSLYYNESGYNREEYPPAELSYSFFRSAGINHQATFIKRKLFFDFFFYQESYKICADWDFFMRIVCLHKISYKYINEFVCRYDFSGMSADPVNYARYVEERDFTLKTFFDPLCNDIYSLIHNKNDKKMMNHFLFLKKYKIVRGILRLIFTFCLLFIPKQFYRRQRIIS